MLNACKTHGTVSNLPPLILHPFNERLPPSALLENSKAALMLAGLIPSDGTDEERLRRRLLSGRHSEVRMLFFVGKDVFRWLEQCCESATRGGILEAAGVYPQSFAGLLTTSPPEGVHEKLTRWGVADHGSIFSRAIGLHSMFAQPPEIDGVTDDFLNNYHKYADALFRCYMELQPHEPLNPSDFHFELYASGEYSRLLESEWEGTE
jgi:hypothetical protein